MPLTSRLVQIESYGAGFGPASASAAVPNALASALAALVQDGIGGTIEVSSTQALIGDTTIPANVGLRINPGGQLYVPAGVTLTIDGPLQAWGQGAISGPGTIVLSSATTPLTFPTLLLGQVTPIHKVAVGDTIEPAGTLPTPTTQAANNYMSIMVQSDLSEDAPVTGTAALRVIRSVTGVNAYHRAGTSTTGDAPVVGARVRTLAQRLTALREETARAEAEVSALRDALAEAHGLAADARLRIDGELVTLAEGEG